MSGDKLDDAIDGAVREIMGTEPPAGLRQRVIRRLAEPERRARFAVPRLAFLAAVLLAVAVGAVVMLTMNRGRTSRANRGRRGAAALRDQQVQRLRLQW